MSTARPVVPSVPRLATLIAVIVAVLAAGTSGAGAVPTLVNPSAEALTGGFPTCFTAGGWGTNTATVSVTSAAHTGSRAIQINMTSASSGDRKVMMTENASCAPDVVPGHQYDLSLWYTATTPNTALTVFRHHVTTGWQYWTDLAVLPPTATYQRAEARTPPVPPGTDLIVFGVSIWGVGRLRTDDYAIVDATPPPPPPTCTGGGDACVRGSWQVLPTAATARAMHAVLIAGSGNDPSSFAAGTFRTTLFDPASGTFTDVPTPADLFCAGHVQLPDGKVLVMGGNKGYPSTDGTIGYQGLRESYVFDPVTSGYTRINDLSAGHWYPSATVLGSGDVVSLGGLGEDSTGTVATQYYAQAQNRWLSLGEAHQTWHFWGLYPSMILLQDGRLFYTGSHVFGNGLPGTGASIYDYTTRTVTDIAGLRKKDERDQSMSVLLPPAQDQRVLTMGGGNVEGNPDAHRLTDIIDLKAAVPAYTPGPLLPTGTLNGGVPQTSTQGKMYLSAVLLPDGKVFETGGGLHNRADPVYEASMFDPATNTFHSGMATDPLPRTYHSTALLLPDGRVMAFGDNPGNGTFDTRVSLYSPPYLFRGPRPLLSNLSTIQWSYGSAPTATVDVPVTRAALLRPVAVTHSSDPNQRSVDLPLTVNGNTVAFNLTSNPNLAPPGWYLLSVVGANGVPSTSTWVRVG
jgi:hypothetical protein